MVTTSITLNTVDKVRDFVDKVKSINALITLSDGVNELDGKSIMAVFSFNLLHPLVCTIYGDSIEEEEEVKLFIEEWKRT